jgi:hypothetical protein
MFSRNSKTRCRVCRRRNTFLMRWSGDWASEWACWRPAHIRKVFRIIKARDESMAAAIVRVSAL